MDVAHISHIFEYCMTNESTGNPYTLLDRQENTQLPVLLQSLDPEQVSRQDLLIQLCLLLHHHDLAMRRGVDEIQAEGCVPNER